MQNGLIENPYFGCNADSVLWVEKEDWIYENTFSFDEELLKNEHIELIFEGLDTYADVFLNDSLVLKADNMFRSWSIECKNKLRNGDNILKIVFHSASKIGKQKAKELSYTLPEGERPFVRKAQYQFGWDFAPRLIGCGIWKPIYLKTWNEIDIKNTRIIQNSLNPIEAKMTLKTILMSDIEDEISIEVINSKSGKKYISQEISLVKGANDFDLNFRIEKPVYWWTYDHGEPYLYNIELIYKKNGRMVYSENKKIGLRTIELVNKSDSTGESFYFKLNKKAIYIKGANYVPQDMFPSRVADNQYRKLLERAKWSNMNMLRVWGGGIYEKDIFYELCDSLGLLVWQDFMFACAMYPGEEEFINNVSQEVSEQVIRLRDHPSIALWCGNNEIDEGWHNWGWQNQFRYSDTDSAEIWHDYENLFHELIPGIVANDDGSRAYWPSSPKYGWGRKESLTSGDMHYWGIWWGKEPFEKYQKKVGRFNSEYGFQALPGINTLKKVIPDENLSLNSKELKCHQKYPRGFETIDEYMKRDWPVPTNLEDYIYVSQLVQAEGIKTAIEAHRTAVPYNMGTLYWQFNDPWPGISWSGIDYYGENKALQYIVKKAYDTILLVPEITDTSINLKIINDSGRKIYYELNFLLFDIEGKWLFSMEHLDSLDGNVQNIVYHRDLDKKLDSILKSDIALVLKVYMIGSVNKVFSETVCNRTAKQSNLKKPEFRFKIIKKGKEKCICIHSDKFAKGVRLSLKDIDTNLTFSDNYFDISPNTCTSIYVITTKSKRWLRKNLKITSLYDLQERMRQHLE